MKKIKTIALILILMISVFYGCWEKKADSRPETTNIKELVQATLTEFRREKNTIKTANLFEECEKAIIDGDITLANQKRSDQLEFIRNTTNSVNKRVNTINTLASGMKLSADDKYYLDGLNEAGNIIVSGLNIFREDTLYSALLEEYTSIHETMEKAKKNLEKNFPPSDTEIAEQGLMSYLTGITPVMDSNFQKADKINKDFFSLRNSTPPSSEQYAQFVKFKFDLVHHTIIESEFTRHLAALHATYFPQSNTEDGAVAKTLLRFVSYHKRCTDFLKQVLQVMREDIVAQEEAIYYKNN